MVARCAARSLRVVLAGSAFWIGMGAWSFDDPLRARSPSGLSPEFRADAAETLATAGNFADVVDKVKPAVIGVRAKADQNPADRNPSERNPGENLSDQVGPPSDLLL